MFLVVPRNFSNLFCLRKSVNKMSTSNSFFPSHSLSLSLSLFFLPPTLSFTSSLSLSLSFSFSPSLSPFYLFWLLLSLFLSLSHSFTPLSLSLRLSLSLGFASNLLFLASLISILPVFSNPSFQKDEFSETLRVFSKTGSFESPLKS